MADGIPDGNDSFGKFPEITSWSPENHMFFSEEIRARIMVILQGALRMDGKVRHPECPFYKLRLSPLPSKDPLTKILEYVAGKSTVQQFLKKSPSKAWYGIDECSPLVLTKPQEIRGLIIEFSLRVDLWAMAGRPLHIDVNGMPLRMEFQLELTLDSALSFTWSALRPLGVKQEGWHMFTDSGARPGFLVVPPPGSSGWNGRFAFETYVRLVLRPYGRNIFGLKFARPDPLYDVYSCAWELQGLTEHGPCTGMTQGNQGPPARLLCKAVHDVFDTEQFSFCLGYPENVDEVWLRDLNIMFF